MHPRELVWQAMTSHEKECTLNGLAHFTVSDTMQEFDVWGSMEVLTKIVAFLKFGIFSKAFIVFQKYCHMGSFVFQ